VQILAQRHEEAKKQMALEVLNENQMLSSMRKTQTNPPFGVDMVLLCLLILFSVL
jgi:hypothetical protein